MSLFSIKKPSRRQFRRRPVEVEDEEGEQSVEGIEEKHKERQSSGTLKLSFEDDIEVEGPVFKLKKSGHSRRMAKRGKRKETTPSSQPESRPESSDEESEGERPSLAYRLSEGFIPDAATIHAVRKKRELARQHGEKSTDFLPLDNTNRVEGTKVAVGKSRLVREDEHDKSDSDDEQAMSFKGDGVTRQMQVLSALENMGSDEDEETKRWEEEQINKGANFTIPTSNSGPQRQTDNGISAVDQSFIYGSSEYPGGDPTTYGIDSYSNTPVRQVSQTHIPDKLVPITVESLKARLQTTLRELTETHSGHSQRLRTIGKDLETAQHEVERLEGESGGRAIDYGFYQEKRGYLRDLLSCLAEKSPVIEKLERSVVAVWSQKAELLLQRRRQDIQDEALQCSQGEVHSVPDEACQRRCVEREARRRRRRERRVKGMASGYGHLVGKASHYEGLSSDDELLETNRLKFVEESGKLQIKCEQVFEDVVEDFSKLSLIKQRFEEWKFGSPNSYEQAYISLCLPKLFAPFVRKQMLQWNPLQTGCADFESMTWFQVLMFYGYREGMEPDLEDEDLQLIPHLVDMVVVPKLTGLLQDVWDPLSATQTRRVTSLIRRLAEDYPTFNSENKATQALFRIVLERLKQSLDNDVFIPLFNSAQLEYTSSAKYSFYQRQFWTCVKLLGNVTAWSGLVAPDMLQELALDGLVNRYLLLSLQNSPPTTLSVTKAEAVISQMPESWFSDGSVVTHPLQGMARFLSHLADLLDRITITSPHQERNKTRMAVYQIAELLVKIQAHREAIAIATQHKLDDILATLRS